MTSQYNSDEELDRTLSAYLSQLHRDSINAHLDEWEAIHHIMDLMEP